MLFFESHGAERTEDVVALRAREAFGVFTLQLAPRAEDLASSERICRVSALMPFGVRELHTHADLIGNRLVEDAIKAGRLWVLTRRIEVIAGQVLQCEAHSPV